MTKSKELVSYSWKPLSPEASTFPHTHTHHILCELQEPSAHSRLNYPFTVGTACPRQSSHAFCTVSLSLFADPERILRRLYVFAEEPCKSTTTTSEPCSPVFKEAQPRPSEHSNLEYHINNLNLYLHVFGLLIIYYCNKSYPTGL